MCQLLSQQISNITKTKVCMLETGKSNSLYDHFDVLQREHSNKLNFKGMFENENVNDNLVRITQFTMEYNILMSSHVI